MSFEQKKWPFLLLFQKSVKKIFFMACKLHALKIFMLLIFNKLIFSLLKIIVGTRYYILRFPAIAQAELTM